MENEKITRSEKNEDILKNKKKRKHHKKKQNKLYLIIKITISIVCIFISLYFFVSLVKTNMIPNKYLLIAGGVLLLFNIVILLMLLYRKVWLNIIAFIFVIVIGSISFIGSNYTNETIDGIKKIVENNYVSTEYYLITLATKEYKEIIDLDSKKIGIISNNSAEVQNHVKEFISTTFVFGESYGILYDKLVNQEIEAMVINSDAYSLLKEEIDNFENSVTIIYKFNIDEKVAKDEEKEEYVFDVSKPFILYISGVDTNGAPMRYWRSDVNIIVVVNPNTKNILLVNTPRDYYLQLHGITGLKDKLTHAGLYGIEMSASTLEDLYDINIGSYIKVCYDALEIIVDSIDGIDVYSDKAFTTSHGKYYIKQGINHFNGKQALAFSQERYAYDGGDRHRGKNQQNVMTAIINKVSQNKKYLLSYTDVLNKVSQYLYTTIELEDIQSLVKQQLETLSKWTVQSISVDGTGVNAATYSIPNSVGYVMEPDMETVKSAKAKIKSVMGE